MVDGGAGQWKVWVAIGLAGSLLAVAAPIGAHTFNHEDRHDVCEADLPPAHAVDDGHTHFHHEAPAAEGHFHGGAFLEAGHTHAAHDHDPCKQVGMDWRDWPDAGPLTKTFREEAVINLDDPLNSLVITDFDAFLSEVVNWTKHHNLIFVGDASLDAYAAAGGMPGSGTWEDPYVIEDRLIRNALLLKDTSRCVVIRDNVIHSRALIGPLIGPEDVVEIPTLVDDLTEQVNATAQELEVARQQNDTDAVQQLEDLLGVQTEEKTDAEQKAENGTYEAMGVLADTTDELAWEVARTLRELLPHAAGRMILDWNGQCIHAYNNIVEDLRVNQNNIRTGYATGGLIEDNRIYHIGQIRHYDGEFRENEVGYREHLRGWLPADDFPSIPSWTAINTDGFNQGWFHHNLVYGAVDLDFHGHHHGAGFFAPESHYHGSLYNVAYMVKPDGTCAADHADYGQTQPLLNLSLLMYEEERRCLPHHNHQLRWTSAVFEDNTIIDPYGYGLRYEDRNHQGDDRWANSEDMDELNAPHFHRTHIKIADNVVFGSIWVDIFNSPTVEVWSDDFSEVRRDLAGMILDAALHLGAEPLPSHPYRNHGWLDMEDNMVFLYDKTYNTRGFHYGWTAYQVNHGFELDALDFVRNEAYLVPWRVTTSADAQTFLAQLESARSQDPQTSAAMAASWGEHRDERPMNFGLVVHYLENSTIAVCDTALLGFDAAVLAWNAIYEDSTVDICDTNTFDSPTYLRYTALPEEREPGLTAPIRGLTEDTSLEPLTDYLMTPVENYEDYLRMQEENIQRWSDAHLANVHAWTGMQLSWADWYTQTQIAGLQYQINATMYWADYTAAQVEAWAEWQAVRHYSYADYQAAQTMSFAAWALWMAQQYTHAVPV